MRVFVDTNVYIDYILEREPFFQAAASVFSYAADGIIEIFVSTLTFTTANFICVDRFKMNREVMAMKVRGHKDFLGVEPITKEDVYQAYDNGWKDYEDGVQYLCAKRCNSDYIITRNGNDFQMSDIPVLTPDNLLDIIEQDL